MTDWKERHDSYSHVITFGIIILEWSQTPVLTSFTNWILIFNPSRPMTWQLGSRVRYRQICFLHFHTPSISYIYISFSRIIFTEIFDCPKCQSWPCLMAERLQYKQNSNKSINKLWHLEIKHQSEYMITHECTKNF